MMGGQPRCYRRCDSNLLTDGSSTTGGGEIVCAQNDPTLTRSLLTVYVEEYLAYFSHPHSIRSAIDAISDDAFTLYTATARRLDLTDEEISSVANLIQFLDYSKLSSGLAETVALDQTIHERIRLAAFSRSRGPLDPRAKPLIDRALRSGNWRDRLHVDAALSRSKDPISTMSKVINDHSISAKRRRELVNELNWIFPDMTIRRQFIRKSIAKRSIIPEFRDIMLVYASSEKNEHAMNELVSRITNVSIDVACSAISLLGWYPTGDYAQRVLKGFKKRRLTASDAVAFAGAALTGMTSLFVMNGYDFGPLEPAPPHPLMSEFAAMAEELCGRYRFSLKDRLRINLSSAGLGSRRALDQLYSILMDIVRRKHNIDEYDLNLAVSDALSELQDRGRLIALEDLWTLSQQSTSNALLRCVSMIAAHGTVEALEMLLDLYNRGIERGLAHAEAERLSSRLAVKIFERNGRLTLPTPDDTSS